MYHYVSLYDICITMYHFVTFQSLKLKHSLSTLRRWALGRISRDRRAPLRVGRRGGELGAISSNHWRPSGVENRGVRKSERKLLVFWRFLAPFYHWPLGCLLSLHVYRMSCVVCVYCVCVWSRHWAVVTVHTLLVAAIPVGSTWSASSFWHLQSPSSEITQGHSKQRRRATHHTGKWSWLHGHALCPNRILRTACSDGALLPSFSPLEKVPSLCVSGQCRCGWRACWHYRPWNPRCYCGSKCGLGCKSQRLVHRRWKWAAKHTQQECHDLFKFEEMCSELGEWSFVTNCWDLHDRHEQQHCGKPHCGLWKRNLDPGILPWVWTRQCLWQGVSPILSLWWVAWQHLSWLQQIWLVLRSSISTQGQDRWRWLSCWQGQLQVVHPGRRWQWCCEWGSRWSELA